MLTEFGGIALPAVPAEVWQGYNVAREPEELAARLADLLEAVYDSEDLAGFCYTQLSDTEQESNGLVWEDRKPKLPLDQLRSIIEGDPDPL